MAWPDRRAVWGALGALVAVAGPVIVVDQVARSEGPREQVAQRGAPPVIQPGPTSGAPTAPLTDTSVLRRLGVPLAGEASGAGPADPFVPLWEASLAGREEALRRAREALTAQMAELKEREARLEARWREAHARHEAAARRWSANARLVTPDGELTFPLSEADANAWLDQVVAAVKKMKPQDAAAMAARWDDGLTVDVLARLSARYAAPLLGAMEPQHAGRVTAMLARGGPPTPLSAPRVHEVTR